MPRSARIYIHQTRDHLLVFGSTNGLIKARHARIASQRTPLPDGQRFLQVHSYLIIIHPSAADGRRDSSHNGQHLARAVAVTEKLPDQHSNPAAGPPVALGRAREEAVRRLVAHYSGDNLTVEEFEARVDASYQATTQQQLEALTADLPVLHGAEPLAPGATSATITAVPAHAVSKRSIQIAVCGGSTRQGAWRPGHHHFSFSVMGGSELDFREVRLPPGETKVTILNVMGGTTVIVPPGLDVKSHGFALMGGFDGVDQQGDLAPDAPRLTIRAFALCGGISIEVREPGESHRDAKRRRKADRKALRTSHRARITRGQ